jgi:hypothetical protein
VSEPPRYKICYVNPISVGSYSDPYPWHVLTERTNRFVGAFATQEDAHRYVSKVYFLACELTRPLLRRAGT